MIAALFCIAGAIAAYFIGRKSLAFGILVVIAIGYAYGIVRANLVSTFSHFIFDAAVVGLYASQFLGTRTKQLTPGNSTLNTWTYILMGWPVVMLFMPFQPLLVSFVGLRGNMFLLPAIFLGSRLRKEDLRILAFGFAVLNLVALGFGVAEYFRGIEPFYPPGPLTETIYNSQDSGGGNRIPAVFVNAHAYAGVMMFTVPLLFGAWALATGGRWRKMLLILGIAAAFVGVLMAATRLGMIMAATLIVIASVSGKLGPFKRLVWGAAIVAVVWSAMHNERWQRYKELDSQTVEDRIAGSVNRSFLEVLEEYPLGNGLGGGGTSIPYFLASEVNRPIVVESEYCRILLEQGIVGLMLWIGFVFWFVSNRAGFVKDDWLIGRRMAWYLCLLSFVIAFLGIGMLTSIPQSFLFLMCIGWTSVNPVRVPAQAQNAIRQPGAMPVSMSARAY
ncbi:MAG: hypothetical protein JOZ32_20615 [Bryobacterales bacterium]|nr:hypothetical protein [Bryobacterales bacterium]